MDLPVMPPVAPMLAKSVAKIPDIGHVEPKWDGFRSIVFRDGDEVVIGSRNEKPLTRYFPEVVTAVLSELPDRCVVDGEIIVPDAGGRGLDFEALLQRIHPAESRVRMLAETTPAHFVGFDLLALGNEDLMGRPFGERRSRLVEALAGVGPRVHLTPATGDMDTAADWFETFEGAGLDGVVAKPLDLLYLPDKRAMFKVKHDRTADCVVAGFRWHKAGGGKVGSLLLGLHDAGGALHHIGVTSSFTDARRLELAGELAPYRMDSLEGHPWAWAQPAGGEEAGGDGTRRPGGPSRWNAGKDLSFEPLRPELVCEVGYDHMEGSRFRHTAQFKRWRPDRDPRSCAYDQLDRPLSFDLAEILQTRPS